MGRGHPCIEPPHTITPHAHRRTPLGGGTRRVQPYDVCSLTLTVVDARVGRGAKPPWGHVHDIANRLKNFRADHFLQQLRMICLHIYRVQRLLKQRK